MARVRIAVGAALVVVAAGGSIAGTGRLNPATRKFDLSVSVRANYTDAQLDALKGLFQKASDLIADVTDGQHGFDKIYVCNNSRGGKSADAWREAGTRSHANVRGLGQAGMRMFLQDDLNTTNANADGGHVIAHEFGHYGYGAYDEYCKGCTTGMSTVAKCLATDGTASLMENFWTRPISEFCVASNHDPDRDTDQSALNKKGDGTAESVWETAHRYFGDLAVPAALPTDAAPASVPIQWKVLKPETRLVLVIDRSGSMNDENKMANAIAGGQLFVDLLRADDKIGVIDFDDVVTTDLGLTAADAAGKAAAKAAVGALFPRNATAIWDGLAAGVALMNADADPACQMTIILLTDGLDNASTVAQGDAIAAAKTAGIQVHTIALGPDADVSGLVAAANACNGKFFQVLDPGALATVFATLQAESSTDGGIITKAQAPIAAGQSAAVPVPVEVSTRTTFLLSWDDPSADLDLALKAPDGSTIGHGTSGAGVAFSSGPGYEFFLFDAAPAGTWTMMVSAVSGSPNYSAQAFADNTNASLSAGTSAPTYDYPNPIILTAHPVGTQPIVGATVTALLTRPDTSQVPIVLYDDGDPAHGDTQAEDGTYSARIKRFSGSGTYTFLVTANTTGAMLQAGEGLSDFPTTGTIGVSGASSTPAQAFQRTTEVSAIVNGNVPIVTQFSPILDRARIDFRKPKRKRGRTIPQDTLTASAHFALNATIDLSTEDTEVDLGAFSATIPHGTFKARGKKKIVARGPNYQVTLVATPPTNRIIINATNQSLAGTANPVSFALLFTDTEGYTSAQFRERRKKGQRVRFLFP